MSSAQKRKRGQPVRKGFKVNAESKAVVVEYEESDEEVPAPPRGNKAGKTKASPAKSMPPPAPAPAAAAPAASRRRGTASAGADSLVSATAMEESEEESGGAKKKHSAAAPSAKVQAAAAASASASASTAAAAAGGKKAFHYPLGDMHSAVAAGRGGSSSSSSAASSGKVPPYLSSSTKMSHRDRLVAAMEDVVGREISALQEYFQQESDAKPEFLAAMKSVLNDTMDEVRSSCPADVTFLPEFKDSKDRRREDVLQEEKEALAAKIAELEAHIKNVGAFGEKYKVTTDAADVKRVSDQVASSAPSSASGNAKQHEVAASQFREILTGINSQCDAVLNDYIGGEVKSTLAYAQQSQEALYDAYQKIRAATGNANLSTIGSSSSSSGKAAPGGGVGVVDYANMLQAQTLVDRPLQQPAKNNSKGATAANATTSAAAKATPKKLLRGFGKS